VSKQTYDASGRMTRLEERDDLQTGTACGVGETLYTAIRLGYAANGRTVTFVHDESWCWDQVQACPTNYAITWAREFRYDGARARYMNRQLDPAGLLLNPPVYTPLSTTWSDYDGDEIYGDFEMVSGSPVNKRSFEPGTARTENPLTTPGTNYYHGDLLGTTRLMSNPSGGSIEPAVYTAFGERISAPLVTDSTRYGYVGAWGYEQNADFLFLHVGARYYDPSSGRFLQRDPIGIHGGLNVFSYADNVPTAQADALGLSVGLLPGPQKKPWDPMDPQRRPRPVPQPSPPQRPRPRPPTPETPSEEIARLNQRLNYTAAGFAGCAAVTWWCPPVAAACGVSAAAAWAGATSVY